MDTETFSAINQELFRFVMMLIQSVTLIAGLIVIASLGSVAWLCFTESRRPARGQPMHLPAAPEAGAYNVFSRLSGVE